MVDQRLNNVDILKYPIGKYYRPGELTEIDVNNWITALDRFPLKLNEIIQSLEKTDIEKQYRKGSWTVRELIHHIADSHLNGYLRTKWILTEDESHIKAYNENTFSKLPDYQENFNDSADLIFILHKKWVQLLRKLGSNALKRRYFHPESELMLKLDEMLGLYAWHGEHHLAHIKLAIENKKEKIY